MQFHKLTSLPSTVTAIKSTKVRWGRLAAYMEMTQHMTNVNWKTLVEETACETLCIQVTRNIIVDSPPVHSHRIC